MKRIITLTILLFIFLGAQVASASVNLVYFRTRATTDSIVLEWGTESELNNSGWFIWRTEENTDSFFEADNPTRVNDRPIAPFGDLGGEYEFEDTSAATDTTYYYWLQDVDTSGASKYHGAETGRIETGEAIGGGDPTATPEPTDDEPDAPTAAATSAPNATVTPRPTRTPAATAENAPTAAVTQPTMASEDETEDDERVFVTSLPTTEPTQTPAPTNTSVATEEAESAENPASTPAPTNTSPPPTATQRVAVVQATTPPQPTAQPVVGESDDSVAADAPTGSLTIVDEPEQNAEALTDDVEIVETEPEQVGAGAEAVPAATEPVAIAEGGNPVAIGEEAAPDVQQPAVQQQAGADGEPGVVLWLGLVAGALLLLVGAGFALLSLRKRDA